MDTTPRGSHFSDESNILSWGTSQSRVPVENGRDGREGEGIRKEGEEIRRDERRRSSYFSTSAMYQRVIELREENRALSGELTELRRRVEEREDGVEKLKVELVALGRRVEERVDMKAEIAALKRKMEENDDRWKRKVYEREQEMEERMSQREQDVMQLVQRKLEKSLSDVREEERVRLGEEMEEVGKRMSELEQQIEVVKRRTGDEEQISQEGMVKKHEPCASLISLTSGNETLTPSKYVKKSGRKEEEKLEAMRKKSRELLHTLGGLGTFSEEDSGSRSCHRWYRIIGTEVDIGRLINDKFSAINCLLKHFEKRIDKVEEMGKVVREVGEACVNRWEGLEDSVATVNGEVEDIHAKLSNNVGGLAREITQISCELRATLKNPLFTGKVDRLEQNITQLQTKCIKSLQSRIELLEKAVRDSDEFGTHRGQSFAKLRNDVDQMLSLPLLRLDGERLGEIERDWKRVIPNLNQKIDLYIEMFERIQENQGNNGAGCRIDEMEERIQAMKMEMTYRSDLEPIDSEVNALKSEVSSMRNLVSDSPHELGIVKESGEVNRRVTQLQSELLELKRPIEKKLQQLHEDVNEVRSEMPTLSRVRLEVERVVMQHPQLEVVRTLTENVRVLKERVANLEDNWHSRVVDTLGKVTVLEREVGEARRASGPLVKRVEEIESDLRKAPPFTKLRDAVLGQVQQSFNQKLDELKRNLAQISDEYKSLSTDIQTTVNQLLKEPLRGKSREEVERCVQQTVEARLHSFYDGIEEIRSQVETNDGNRKYAELQKDIAILKETPTPKLQQSLENILQVKWGGDIDHLTSEIEVLKESTKPFIERVLRLEDEILSRKNDFQSNGQSNTTSHLTIGDRIHYLERELNRLESTLEDHHDPRQVALQMLRDELHELRRIQSFRHKEAERSLPHGHYHEHHGHDHIHANELLTTDLPSTCAMRGVEDEINEIQEKINKVKQGYLLYQSTNEMVQGTLGMQQSDCHWCAQEVGLIEQKIARDREAIQAEVNELSAAIEVLKEHDEEIQNKHMRVKRSFSALLDMLYPQAPAAAVEDQPVQQSIPIQQMQGYPVQFSEQPSTCDKVCKRMLEILGCAACCGPEPVTANDTRFEMMQQQHQQQQQQQQLQQQQPQQQQQQQEQQPPQLPTAQRSVIYRIHSECYHVTPEGERSVTMMQELEDKLAELEDDAGRLRELRRNSQIEARLAELQRRLDRYDAEINGT